MVLAALCMKIVVYGFMIGRRERPDGQHIGDHLTKRIVIPMKDGGEKSGGKQSKGECPFSSLSMGSLAGTDVAPCAGAGFHSRAGLRASAVFTSEGRFVSLRPPLHGPAGADLTI